MIPSWYAVQFHLGPIPVNVWGLFVAAGFLIGTWLAARNAPRYGFAAKDVVDFAVWVIVAGMLGARIGHVVLYEPAYYLAHPWDMLRMWEGGLSSFGGFAGAIIAAIWFVHTRHFDRANPRASGEISSQEAVTQTVERDLSTPLRPERRSFARDDGLRGVLIRFSDLLLPPFLLGWFIGRLGCYSIHDHPGIPCIGFLCVPFPDGTRRLDMGLLDGLLALAIAIGVWVWRRGGFYTRPPGRQGVLLRATLRKDEVKPCPTGMTSAIIIALYGIGRFALDFLRVGDVRYAGFTPAQFGSIALVVLAIVGAWRVRWLRSAYAPPSRVAEHGDEHK